MHGQAAQDERAEATRRLAAFLPGRPVRQPRLARRKTDLLITHSATLFSAFVADVRKSDLAPSQLGRVATDSIARVLIAGQLPVDTFGDLDPSEVRLARTADRSVLGCMNAMTWTLRHAMPEAGGVAAIDRPAISVRLNQGIHAPRAYVPAIELARRRSRSRPRSRSDWMVSLSL